MNFYTEKRAIRKYFNGLQTGAGVLQIACGSGYFSKCFREQEFCGIDTSAANISYAKKHFRGNFKVHKSIDLDFGDQSMDAVLLIGVFHNVDAPTSAYLIKEIKRVMKPDGRLLILEDVFPVSRFRLFNAIAQRYDPPAFIRTAAEYQALFDQGVKLIYGGRLCSGAGGYHLFYQDI